MGLVTLTFELLTLKLVCESHQRWGTFIPNLGTLGLWVLELFAMYATDGQTDGRTSEAYCPLPYGRRHNKHDKWYKNFAKQLNVLSPHVIQILACNASVVNSVKFNKRLVLCFNFHLYLRQKCVLERNAMHKHGLCRHRAMAGCPSVCMSYSYTV